jgi:hypothetical protein
VPVERHNKFVWVGESRRVEETPTLDGTRAALDDIVYCNDLCGNGLVLILGDLLDINDIDGKQRDLQRARTVNTRLAGYVGLWKVRLL